jgi:phasin family protein
MQHTGGLSAAAQSLPDRNSPGQDPALQGNHLMKTAEEFMSFSQANVEAFVKSSQIFSTGLQDLSKQMAATAQAAMDETMSTFRAMATVKSVKEAFDLQATLAKSTMEKAVAQTTHVTETSFKLAEQAIAPIAGRVTHAVESFKVA